MSQHALMGNVHILTGDDIESLAEFIQVADLIDVVREGYRDRGTGANANLRRDISPDTGGVLAEYSAHLPSLGTMGCCVMDWGFNEGDSWTVVALFSTPSGKLQALIDGTAWNSHKVGATGAVAADSLANPEASTIGIIGSGIQAGSQLLYLAEVTNVANVLVYSPTESHRNQFAASMEERLNLGVDALSNPEDVVKQSEIVVTATTSRTPVFDGSVLTPGTHINAVGQTSADGSELDIETISRAKYVPDLKERALNRAGSYLTARESAAVSTDKPYAELGDVIAGVLPGREASDEITVFDSGGTGIETIAVATLLYETAVEQGIGTKTKFQGASQAPPFDVF